MQNCFSSIFIVFHCFCNVFHQFSLCFHCFCIVVHQFSLVFHCFCNVFHQFSLFSIVFALCFINFHWFFIVFALCFINFHWFFIVFLYVFHLIIYSISDYICIFRKKTNHLLGLTCNKQIQIPPLFPNSWNLLITGSVLGQVIFGRVLFEENP